MAVYAVPANAGQDETSRPQQELTAVPEAAYQKLHVLQGHWDNVNDAEFSPNGEYAATVSDDASLIVWNVSDGSQKFDVKFENKANVMAATFSPDNKYIFAGYYDKDLKGRGVQFSLKKGKMEYAASLPGVMEMDYSPDGKSLLVGYLNGGNPLSIINIKKAKKGKKKDRIVHLQGHTDMNMSAEFSPDGNLVLTAALDGNMVVWNAKSGRRKFGIKADLEDASFSPDGQYIATSSISSIKIYSAKDGEKIRTLVESTNENLGIYELLFDVAYHPNGQTLAAASSNGTVFFFDTKTGKNISKITNAHLDQIVSIDYNFDGSMLITGSRDDTAIIWKLK